MSTLVQYDFSDGIATLTLDDGKANAMSVQMMQALNSALDRAEADRAVVVLTGRERMFCGGFDLGVFKRERSELLRMLEDGARLSERLLAFPQPVVAACTGHAVAMGVFLLLSTDLRLGVDQGAKILINEVQIGLTLPHFAIEVCRQRLAPAHVHHAITTATPYTPQQALAAGFLDALVPAESLAQVAHSRAQDLLKLHRGAFTATKLRLQRQTLLAMQAAIRDDVADWQANLQVGGLS